MTKLNLLLPDNQYTEIRVVEGSTGIAEIKANLWDQKKEEIIAMASEKHHKLSIEPSISLKVDNQGSIALAHNPVYYAQTKFFDFKYHYICDKVAVGQKSLQYIATSKMITDELTKVLIHIKFHTFVK